jgi:hypothetical protein
VAGAEVDLAAPTELREPGREVVLAFGKVTLRCKFHPKSGLLSTTRDGMASYGRPNQRLLKALREVALGAQRSAKRPGGAQRVLDKAVESSQGERAQ